MFSNNHYHIYNRGAHKAPIFGDHADYQRFLHLLYIANSERSFEIRMIEQDIFNLDFSPALVEIVAYCLMPNHYHIALKEISEGNITKFIQKLSTAYTMYYNLKYKHSGTIFQGRYKAKLVTDDEYLQALVDYIHLNPFGLKEPILMKDAHKDFMEKAIEYSKEYEYSSLKDYLDINRPQKVIIRRFNLR